MLYRRTYRDPKTDAVKTSKIWWYEIVFNGARIRESTGLTSKQAARQAETKRKEELRSGAIGLRRTEAKLFRVVAVEYLALKRPSLSPRSFQIEEQSLAHLLPFFGGILTSDIEAQDVARYQERRKDGGAAAATINLEIGTLRAILRRKGAWAFIQPDVRMLRTRDDVGRALAGAEEQRLLAECGKSRSKALFPAVTLALNTGLRYGELVGLRWAQVDLENRRLTVGESKTAAGTGRAVPLNERASGALSLWATRFPDRTGEQFVFPAEKYGQGGAAYGQDPARPIGDLKEAWEAAKRRSGVKIRWHDLRHTFCSRIVERGTGLPMLAVIMGWSPATTARMAKRYGHVSTEALREVVRLLDGGENAKVSPQYPPQSETAPGDSVVN